MLKTPAEKTRTSLDGQRFWTRIVSTVIISAAASTFLAVGVVRQAGTGSYTAFLLVIPLLGALIASGIRPSPGVGDSEFDWILAAFFTAAGLLTIRLLSQRLPALSELWRWDHYAAVVWTMATGMVLFSVRHVMRLWRVWIFVLCCVPAMPFLLLTAHLGGTDDDAVLAGALVGTVAVYLATSTFGQSRRLPAAAINLGVAIGLDHLLGSQSVLARTVIVAGVVPLLSVVWVRRAGHLRVAASLAVHPAKGGARFPHVGARSHGVLIASAAALLLSSPPVSGVPPAVVADDGWITRLNLERAAEFTFIRRFVGPEASLTRYTLTTHSSNPSVAVDVLTAPQRARLNDYPDAVWYPSPTPVNYRSIDLGGAVGGSAQAAQSDADSPAADPSGQWYAITWVWLTTTAYQRVTVVVNQDLAAEIPPPPPEPITWTSSLLRPMLWLTRQQPAPTGIVPNRVLRTAEHVAGEILLAGAIR